MPDRQYGVFGHGDQIALVRSVYDAFARRDVDAVLEHIAPDGRFYPGGTAKRVGREEPYVGHDGIRAYFADAEALWDELVLHADDVRVAAGGVVVFGTVRGRIGGEDVSRRAMWAWKLRGGQVVSMRATDLGPV